MQKKNALDRPLQCFARKICSAFKVIHNLHKVVFFPCLLFLSAAAFDARQKDNIPSVTHEFHSISHNVSMDEEGLISGYGKLETLHKQMVGIEKAQADQFMAMRDALLGLYQDAEEHYFMAFPASLPPGKWPVSDATIESAIGLIERAAKNRNLVTINDSAFNCCNACICIANPSHSQKMGFNYLALDALMPELENNERRGLESTNLPARGYPLDHFSAGFYLREPIHAELIREAVTPGFELVAYEALNATSREERENEQASALAKFIANDPGIKILIIAGYFHIWKVDGWMADGLQKNTGRDVFSIDQTSRMPGCAEGINMDLSFPFDLVANNGTPWASAPDKVDITIVHPARRGNARLLTSGWLTLGGCRKSVQPDMTACAEMGHA